MGGFFAKILEMTPITIFGLLDVENIGFIHWQLLFQVSPDSSILSLSLPPEIYQRIPELKRQGELLMRDVSQIMEAPSQKEFRRGLLPSEKKPLPREKQLAAFLLATKEKRESLRAVMRVWNYILAMLSDDPSRRQAARVDFFSRRTKVLRKWRAEPRFKKLMEKFERGYTESLVNEMASVISRAPVRPLLESARAIYIIGRVIAPMEKRAHYSFQTELAKRFETTYKDDRQAAQALVLAGMYAMKPYVLKPLADKKWSDFLRREVNFSFSLQRDAVKALAAERNKKRRAAAVSSLDALMVIRQIILLNSLGMIDHAAYGDRLIQDLTEKLRKSMRKKPKKKK